MMKMMMMMDREWVCMYIEEGKKRDKRWMNVWLG